jgi:tRNA-(ms[2]io[6]A)-hydroxylase
MDLHVATPPGWVSAVLDDFDVFLADHANCERKASAMAMGMIVKYPDRDEITAGLIDLAQEELQHFAEVHSLMRSRGAKLRRDEQDVYVTQLTKLARHGRDDRFLDRLLIASVVECRGAERFGLIAEHAQDQHIRDFYVRLRKGELKHGHVFVDFALRYVDAKTVYARLERFMAAEAQIMLGLDFRAALH